MAEHLSVMIVLSNLQRKFHCLAFKAISWLPQDHGVRCGCWIIIVYSTDFNNIIIVHGTIVHVSVFALYDVPVSMQAHFVVNTVHAVMHAGVIPK